MNEWMNQDVFKTWTDAQKRLWDSLSTTLPAFKPPEGFELWHETYRTNISAWETAVKQSLAMQASWLAQWAQRVGGEQGTPEMAAAWSRQVEEVTQHWITTQNELWDRWFDMLRAGSNAPPAAAPQPTAPTPTPPAQTAAPDSTPPTARAPAPAPSATKSAEPAQKSVPASPQTATPTSAGAAPVGRSGASKSASASKTAKSAPARKRTTKKAD